jgi:hypothetical protein
MLQFFNILFQSDVEMEVKFVSFLCWKGVKPAKKLPLTVAQSPAFQPRKSSRLAKTVCEDVSIICLLFQ